MKKMTCIAMLAVCLLLLLLPACAHGPAATMKAPEKPVMRLRGIDVSVDARRIITGYDSPAALIDVGGELFAGRAGTFLTLRPFEETCKIAVVDIRKNLVVIHRPGYGQPRKAIEMTPRTGPAPDWGIPHDGLSASLASARSEYPFASQVLVTFRLRNESRKEVTVETGWRRKPHFWFFMSHSRTGPVKLPPSLELDRLFDFSYGRGPVKPVRLLPGKSISVELDLNQFLEHAVGTPEAMGSLSIGSAPAWYEAVGVYQQLRQDDKDTWFGSVTSNKIAFRVLPKGQEPAKAPQTAPADADKPRR